MPTNSHMQSNRTDHTMLMTAIAAVALIAVAATLFVSSRSSQGAVDTLVAIRDNDAAVASVSSLTGELAVAIAGLGDTTPIREALVAQQEGLEGTGLVGSAWDIVEAVERGDTASAAALFEDSYLPQETSSLQDLRDRGNRLLAEFTTATSTAGITADIILVALLVAGAGGLVLMSFIYVRRFVSSKEAELVELDDQRMARFKDEFLANVSHELRTPLTGIVGFSHLLVNSPLSEESAEAVDYIIGQSAELSRMVDDLLAVARADAGLLSFCPESVSVINEVEEVIEYMKLVGAEVEIQCHDARVWVDPERFRQILRNLLVNAHQHGRPGIRITGQELQDTYVCHVVDRGPGVKSEVEKRLFTRFIHPGGQRVSGSLGLGLAVVHELSKLMGCEVTYRRIRGETHFVFSVPLASTQTQPSKMDKLVSAAI